MPYRRIEASIPQPNTELVEGLAQELRKKPDIIPSSLALLDAPDTPDITEEETHRKVIHVRVIWNQWAHLPPEERGRVIIEAYKQAQSEDVARRISIAMGLTKADAQRLGIK